MDAGLIWAIVGSIAGIAATGLAFWQVREATRETENRTRHVISQETLEGRLDELSKSMRMSARLVEQVSAELEARAATARKLQQEAAAAEALAAIHKEQAEAVRRVLDTELESAARRIRKDSIVIGIASFIGGSATSFVVTLLVHPLH